MPPLAVTLNPSVFPYQFTELVAFRGDFDQSVRPGEVVNPKGIAYHRALDRLLVSLSPFNADPGARVQIINAVFRHGTRTRFAPSYKMFQRVESKIVIAPDSGPPVTAGFTPGEIFIGRGPQTEISRLSAAGEVILEVFAQSGESNVFWSGLCFDTEGDFGGRLIAVGSGGKIYLINSDGTLNLFTDLAKRLEGAAIAPHTFGPHAKNLIVGVEGLSDIDPHSGEIYAIDKNKGQTLLASIGHTAENIQFIPPMSGTYCQTQLALDRERENRLICVSSSQFFSRRGRMIAVSKMKGELLEVAWDGSRYTQQSVGRVPGRWTTSGFNVRGTELEAGCFAVKSPRIPNWSDWEVVPGGFTTDRAPAAATDAAGDIVLFSKNQVDREVYLNSLETLPSSDTGTIPPDDGEKPEWRGWRRDPAQILTPHALACSLHNNRMYAFAVRNDGRIAHKFYTEFEDEQTIRPWLDVPGGTLTNTSVACATVNGRLTLCALSQEQKILLNELAPGGRYWSGWNSIPLDESTDATPTVVSFQDELYVFIKGTTSKRILVKTRTVEGEWMPWAEVPGPGLSDTPINAVVNDGQLFLFIKGIDQNPWFNIASETGTWSGWMMLPNPGATDTALAPASVGNRIYLIAKGIDQQLYVRATI
jgi:hypothetical protein